MGFDTLQDAYQKGISARQNGEPIHRNPYIGSDLAACERYWNLGWERENIYIVQKVKKSEKLKKKIIKKINKKIIKMSDVMTLLSELKEEVNYFGNSETLAAFDKKISEWGINPEHFRTNEMGVVSNGN